MKRNVVAINKRNTQSDWETPPAVFEKLNEDFGPFDIDLTASSENHLVEPFFGPGSTWHEDALEAPWGQCGTRGYSNPPYGPFVPLLLAKAVEEATEGFATTLLLPMRVTQAFRKWVLGCAGSLCFCDKRLTFYEHGTPRLNKKTGKPDCAMFDSIVVHFSPVESLESELHVREWHVPDHV